MRAFVGIVGFELATALRRLSTHVYFLIFFALAFLISALACGIIPTPASVLLGTGGQEHFNSPDAVRQLVGALGIFGVMVTAAISGQAIYRDYQARIHPLFFTTPVPEHAYLFGRFTGSVLVNAWVFASIPLGLLLPTLLPGADHTRLGPVMPMAYVQPYLMVLLPNLVMAGAIFFVLAAATRQMLPNYLGGVGLLVAYLMASAALGSTEHRTLAALADPFGLTALEQLARYWTPAEKNTLLLPLASIVTWNRLIWLGVAGLVVLGGTLRFKFAHVASEKTGKRRAAEPEGAGLKVGMTLSLPAVSRRFDLGARLRQLRATVNTSTRTIVLNVYFAGIAGAGLIVLAFFAAQVGKIYDTPLWPVTYHVLEVLGGSYRLFVIVIITFFAGELCWQERDLGAAQLHDSLPVPTWVAFTGKFLSLSAVVVILQALTLAAGVATQASHHFFRFQLGLYGVTLFGIDLVFYLLTCVLALFIQAVVHNKYLAHFVFVLAFFGTGFVATLGFEHDLYRYGRWPQYTYSDMNGFGPFLPSLLSFMAYWAAVAVLMALATNLLWVRGQEVTWRARVAGARERLGPRMLTGAALVAVAAAGLGGWIFYNTNVLNHYRTAKQREELVAEGERRYRKDEALPQPKVVDVDVRADLLPRQQTAVFTGTYGLVNRNAVPVTEIQVFLPPEEQLDSMTFDPPATLADTDADRGRRVYRLAAPLPPAAPLQCRFVVALRPRGFTTGGPVTTDVVDNGTFLNSGVLPTFGYDRSAELGDAEVRRKHGLPPRPRMRPLDDPHARDTTYIAHDADWVTFKATVTTDPDQIAIAPGYLTREWTENGRRCFRYEMDAPILDFFSFLSARYQVKRDKWNDVNLEIYYQAGHEWNLDAMMKGMKSALDYDTKAFGPYQHRQVRILEFPRYASFAQSFPNTIPYSEAIGFIMRRDEVKDVDYAYYVTAHEVSHQWFAHQLIGADCQGSTMLSESLAQYAALMIMEHEYGPDHMKTFLSDELDKYLLGRAVERERELPLDRNENQQYIHYNKGSLVFYALKEYLGEDRLDGLIHDFVAQAKFKGAPYPTGPDLYQAIRSGAPPELQGLVDDLLDRITLWDLEAKSAVAKKRPDGKYDVTLTYSAKKLHADEHGVETEVPVSEPIEIGVYAPQGLFEHGEPRRILLSRQAIQSGTHDVTVVVDSAPGKVGIDPRHVLIDRHSEDNLTAAKVQSDST